MIAVVLLVSFLPGSVSLHNGLLAPLFMLLVVAVALNNSPLLRWRPLIFLGEVSYGIYIFQEPVHKYVEDLNAQYLHFPAQAIFYFYVLVLVGVAAACYYLVEKTYQEYAE